MLRCSAWSVVALAWALTLLAASCAETQGIGPQAKPTWDYLHPIDSGQGGDIPDPTLPDWDSNGDPGDPVYGGGGGAPVPTPLPPGPPAQIEFGDFDRRTHLLTVKVTTQGFARAGNLQCDVPGTMYIWRNLPTSSDYDRGLFEYVVGLDAADVGAGASGELKVSVKTIGGFDDNSPWESHDTATKAILIAPEPVLSYGDVNFKFDTLYAIPLEQHVVYDQAVTIVVGTGRPANPFQYMTGVRVTVPQGAGWHYVDHSFNVGAPGGEADDPDGFWEGMKFDAATEAFYGTNFLLAPDSFYSDVDAEGGLSGLDFNVTPLGGEDVEHAWGALFNFQARFDNPGRWPLGFQKQNVVNRTYYQDQNQSPDYYWGDISNDHPGIANTVTVTY